MCQCVFAQDLPLVVIRCAETINGNKKVAAEMKIDGVYDGNIGIKLRGNSSQSFNQKKYTIETRDENQKDKAVSLFGLPAEEEWVLMCPYNDVSMMRDAFASQLWNEMGHWGPHFKMVEVMLNGEYIGVYGFAETITKKRIGGLTPKKEYVDGTKKKKIGEYAPEEVGFLLRVDKYDESDNYFRSKHKGLRGSSQMMGGMMGGFPMGGMMGGMNDVVWTCRYPAKKKISETQWDYIRDYIDKTEDALLGDDAEVEEMAKWIDINSFIDYFLHTELSLNADAYKSSSYFYKTPGTSEGRLFAGPVWDYNLAYGCCSFCNASDINAWAFDGCETSPTPAFWKLFAVHPQLKKLVSKRYKELRSTIFCTKHIHAIVDSYAKQLSKVQAKQFERYPELLKSKKKSEDKPQSQGQHMGGFGGFGGFGGGFGGFGGFGPMGGGMDMNEGMLNMFRSYTVSSYEEEIEYLKKWLRDRLEIMDERFL